MGEGERRIFRGAAALRARAADVAAGGRADHESIAV